MYGDSSGYTLFAQVSFLVCQAERIIERANLENYTIIKAESKR